MADDIVTQLRERQYHWSDRSGIIWDDNEAAFYCEAADEIERLRHELGTVHADFAAIDELRDAGIERWHRTFNSVADWLRDIGYPFDWTIDTPPPEAFRSFIEESWVRQDGTEWDSETADMIRQQVAEDGGWNRG